MYAKNAKCIFDFGIKYNPDMFFAFFCEIALKSVHILVSLIMCPEAADVVLLSLLCSSYADDIVMVEVQCYFFSHLR